MIIPGVTYIMLGIFIKLIWAFMADLRTGTLRRMGNIFIATGSFNVMAHSLKWFFPAKYSVFFTMAGTIAILIFGVLCLVELNKVQNSYDERMNKILNGENIFAEETDRDKE